jgi:N-ethylmaleimide reductase
MVLYRPMWSGCDVSRRLYRRDGGRGDIAGHADAIAFGRIFISNPTCRACNRDPADAL